MATNSLTVVGWSADLEITDGVDSYGFKCANGTRIVKSRGDQWAGAVRSGAPTYKDAGPFNLFAWEDFSGGFGQVMANAVFGGAGQGGQPNRFLAGKCWTLKGGLLLPGMLRNLIFPTGSTSPFPLELERPAGVLPVNTGALYDVSVSGAVQTRFVAAANQTIKDIYILVKTDDPGVSASAAGVRLYDSNNNLLAIFSSAATVDNSEFKWFRYNNATGVALVSGTTYMLVATTNGQASIGCFAGTNNDGIGNFADGLQPYAQAFKAGSTTDTYKMWARTPQWVLQLNNAGSYFNPVVTDKGLFNASAPGTTELTLAGSFLTTGAYVFNNKLYIGMTDGGTAKTQYWTAAQAAAVGVATAEDTNICIGPGICEHEGQAYFIDGGNQRRIVKSDLNIGGPAVSTLIIDNDKIGMAGSNGRNLLTNLTMFRGLLYAFKPEGVFCINEDPSKITTTAVPRVIQVWDAGQLEHTDNGKFAVQHQGIIFFNVRNRLYQLSITPDGNTIVVLVPPYALGRYRSNPYISGITSDGQTLYVSYDNVGVVAWTGQGWHEVTEYFNPATVEGQRSALTFALNPGGATDYLYTGDGRQLVRLPIPNIGTAYSTQIYQENQNKAFWFATSVMDFDLANIKKYVHSLMLKGSVKNWRFKAALALYQSGDPSYRTIVEKALNEGLLRDKWRNPSTGLIPSNFFNFKVITNLINSTTHWESTTQAPAIWLDTDFQNESYSSEKFCNNDAVINPVAAMNMAFILYGWRADGAVPAASTYTDLMYLESMVLKYLPPQRFLPTWQMTLDLDALTSEGANASDSTTAQAAITFLENRAKSLTPSRFTFRDTSGQIRTVDGYLMNNQFSIDPTSSHQDSREIWAANTVPFRIIATEPE